MASEITQLPISMIAFLGGLLGSILTIAIGKALDLIQKRQEHKYSLQKAFFEKKMKVAEAIVVQSQKLINILGPFNSILCKVPEFAAIGDLGIFQSQMTSFGLQAQKLIQETGDCVLAARLYFDTAELDRVTSLCYEKLLNSVLMLSLMNNEMSKLKSDSIGEAGQEILKKAIQFLSEFSSTLTSIKTVSDKFIFKVRNEMKRYEP